MQGEQPSARPCGRVSDAKISPALLPGHNSTKEEKRVRHVGLLLRHRFPRSYIAATALRSNVDRRAQLKLEARFGGDSQVRLSLTSNHSTGRAAHGGANGRARPATGNAADNGAETSTNANLARRLPVLSG